MINVIFSVDESSSQYSVRSLWLPDEPTRFVFAKSATHAKVIFIGLYSDRRRVGYIGGIKIKRSDLIAIRL